MHNKINKLTLAVAVASATLSGQTLGGAFQLNEQSVSGQGNAFAGRTSNVTDASIVYGNPAGMSFLDRAQITAGATYLDVSTDIENTQGMSPTLSGPASTPGISDSDVVPGTTIPFGYYVQPIDERWTFGFGVYAPFGVITDYDNQSQGRYFGNYSDVEVVTAQPTLSYKFNDKLSVGLGITYNMIDGELESKTPNPIPGGSDGTVNVQGDDEAWGYNVGVLYRPVESTTLGLTYRSKVDYDLEGDVKASDVFNSQTLSTFSDSSAAGLSITLPETVDFSVTHELDDRWTIMAGAAYVRWSRFDKLVVENDIPGVDINEAQDYDDAWQYAAGLSYQLNRDWVLRSGLAYDDSPISDDVRTVRVPSGDRTIFSLGAGWSPIPNMTVDLAYTYLWEDTASVEQVDEEKGTSFSGDYKNTAHGVGAQLTYRF
ncbi:OmpP1/FadL family transporter [Chromohalobacter japonicus]|uniref:OmpP1/FadL family transporter n=1 Tax=Chromohalobacter japonicus TaxID=223900 RepID=UPI000590783C|nr:outer membrane protein transport protein [Chromohalobacter japonicus]